MVAPIDLPVLFINTILLILSFAQNIVTRAISSVKEMRSESVELVFGTYSE